MSNVVVLPVKNRRTEQADLMATAEALFADLSRLPYWEDVHLCVADLILVHCRAGKYDAMTPYMAYGWSVAQPVKHLREAARAKD